MVTKITDFTINLLRDSASVSFEIDGGHVVVLVPLDTSGNKTESQLKATGFEVVKSALESAILACENQKEK